ncbi:unnamed protein product [Rotaria magnacalcarata]|uniref:DDE Tnp4 domain-containing protein n=3 Tax=Rotaria magnacalcarata TaxID=392030 RepID=A0A819CVJ6_9BILA|nr:unnamed protein product [Rotaria magnacalcarata]CAF2211486.1 unnamed protein product [Rotaria magnacalcarata]CAF3818842.1 unnamed protein product [Rotaria magnacalcarata]
MDKTSCLALVHTYLSKQQRLTNDISNLRSEYQRLLRKYRRNLNQRNKLIAILIMLNENSFGINHRGIWILKKNGRWWLEVVPKMSDNEFKQNFRLERGTYSALMKQIEPYLRKTKTNCREPIPVEKKVCCALYCLGSSAELRTIGNLFGIGKSTSSEILHEFCSIMIELFIYNLVKFPDNHQEIKDTSSKFLRKFGYPMCIGAVDGTHISIKPPLGLETDYFNYKKYHSVIMLAVVNADLGFTYINVGAPGRCNDASVYSQSNLSDVIKNSIYEDHYMTVNNTKIQSHLIADSAFALDQTLLKPFPDRIDMPRQHRMFNYRLSRCRSTVERAFGMMKNRFRILHKKMEFNLDNTINIIKTAVIMHNICILHGDVEDILWHQPYPVHKKPSCPITTTNGIGVREAMIQYFEQNPL